MSEDLWCNGCRLWFEEDQCRTDKANVFECPECGTIFEGVEDDG